ncbi:MAG: caspase family protein [Verrucomicrobiaceae bacterium]|nr:caspase family protein [Verrucomicrobiaceae bacterium]
MKATLLLLCLTLTTHAAERIALVIGNDAYQHARKLNTAVNDATAVAAKLKQLQFDVISLPNAGVEQMLTALESLKTKAADARAVLVYYAGHGIESDGANYLVPVDAKLEREIQAQDSGREPGQCLGRVEAHQCPRPHGHSRLLPGQSTGRPLLAGHPQRRRWWWFGCPGTGYVERGHPRGLFRQPRQASLGSRRAGR